MERMPIIDTVKTGQNIRSMRIKSGMTIKDIQDVCGISAAAVCKWQNGQAVPTVDNLVVLSSIWNVRIDDIIATCTA